MRLFIIDWSRETTTPLIDSCKKSTHKVVGSELADGAEAYRKTGLCKPDAVVVNYAVKPLHGRVTATQIRKRKTTAELPIYFIGGSEDDNEQAVNIGVCLSEEEFQDLLDS